MANKEESTTIDSYQVMSFFIESEGERTMDSAADCTFGVGYPKIGGLMDLESSLIKLHEIRQNIALLKDQELALKGQIHELSPEPFRMTLGDHRFVITRPYRMATIVDPELVPAVFSTIRPSKKLVGKHFDETGEIAPGCEIETYPGNIKITPVTREDN
jgi:hypothetical protein